jgi:hypothetical protein
VVLAGGLVRSAAALGGATEGQGATTLGGVAYSNDGGMASDAERIEFYRDMGCKKGRNIDWRD